MNRFALNKKENIVAYILYMWQVEDLIRACQCDKEKVEELLLSKYTTQDYDKEDLRQWYFERIDMMLSEGVQEKGHLQINRIAVMELETLHNTLLKSENEYIYTSLHYQILPAIIQLKGLTPSENNISEIELCLNAIYGYTTMKMKGTEISAETQKSIQQISNFLSMLSLKYKEYKDNN